MLYNIIFNSRTRQLSWDEVIIATQGDINSDIIDMTYIDSENLLSGYSVYAIFDNCIRREVVDDKVVIPTDVLIGNRIRFQLMFCKDNERFYSLNVLQLELNKVIRR